MTVDDAGRRRIGDLLAEERLLAIVRGREPSLDAVVRCVAVLVDEGVRLIEVSLTTPGALDAIAATRTETGTAALIGAGTVLGPDDARRAADAGAEFLLSPGLPVDLPGVLGFGLPTVVGALTPSEIVQALHAGASAVKVFPADAMGPAYLGSLLGPLPHANLVAVGGVHLESSRAFLDAGAIAVGVGSPLMEDAADGGDLDGLRRRARAYRNAVAK